MNFPGPVFPSLKRGPRGGVIPSGRCICDDPQLDTVKDVRHFAKENGICNYCGDRGLKLMKFGDAALHVRCLIRRHGWVAFVHTESHVRRSRLCCLGKVRMKKLLYRITDDGGRPSYW